MITQHFELQWLRWESNPEGPTHVEEWGVEEAKLLKGGVCCAL